MAPTSTTPQALLSYLVGPGPRAAGALRVLRLGLSNLDEGVHALRVQLSLLPRAGAARPLAQVEWEGLLPRRSQRELEVRIDWSRAELQLADRVSAMATQAQATAQDVCVLRAELFDGGEQAQQVLEIGLAGAAAVHP